MLSQGAVFLQFGVEQWRAVPALSKPWTTVKVGDLVLAEATGVCMVLGVRNTTARVCSPDGEESRIDGSTIKAILARTQLDNWDVRKGYWLRIHPHQGASFQVQVPDAEAGRIQAMPCGFRKDTETRKACLPTALQVHQRNVPPE